MIDIMKANVEAEARRKALVASADARRRAASSRIRTSAPYNDLMAKYEAQMASKLAHEPA
jgi:hypothetical protein